MEEETILSAKAITLYSIITGVASGAAAFYLANKFGDKKVTKQSATIAIGLAFAATILSAFIIKESTKK